MSTALPNVIGRECHCARALMTYSERIERMMRPAATYRKPTCARTRKMPAEGNLSPQSAKSESRKSLTKPSIDSFSLSFEKQSLRDKKTRYHWMVCSTKNPDLLVSWGYASTHEVAEIEARNELEGLASGRTEGGRVSSSLAPFNGRNGGIH